MVQPAEADFKEVQGSLTGLPGFAAQQTHHAGSAPPDDGGIIPKARLFHPYFKQ